MPERALRAALLACVHADETVAPSVLSRETDLHALVELARIHRVEGLVHDALTRLDRPLPTATRLELNDLRMRAIQRELLATGTLARLDQLLTVPFLVLKGPVLAAQCHDQPGLRSFSDVDVLVRRQDFVAALTTLTDGGFTEVASNWGGFLAHGVAEVPLADPLGIVDLHWHPIALGSHRRDIPLDTRALFDRAVEVDVGGTDVRTLGPEDTLLHLCINAGLAGGRRLLPLVDVDRVVRRRPIDWGVLVDRAHDAGAHALGAGVLQRVGALLDTPVAPDVLEQLQPFPGWLRANRLVERRRRPRRLDRGVASGLVLSAGRGTPRLTLAALLRLSRTATRARLGRPGPTDPGGSLNWRRSAGAARDAQHRARYLAWVASRSPVRVE